MEVIDHSLSVTLLIIIHARIGIISFGCPKFVKNSGNCLGARSQSEETSEGSHRCLSPTEPQVESKADISQEEQLHQDKQRSLLEESSISIPCLVKQPGQPELKGVIQKVERDRFIVYIPDSDSTITVSKLFVYPDFSNSVGQIDKNPRKKSPPSKNNPRKTRRKKGQGNGTIYYRMVTKNGRQYQEAYYHYIENGKKRTKYIPKKLLDRVKEAESRKLPVTDILVLLVGKDKNPRKSSDTFQDGNFQDGDCIIAVRGAQSL